MSVLECGEESPLSFFAFCFFARRLVPALKRKQRKNAAIARRTPERPRHPHNRQERPAQLRPAAISSFRPARDGYTMLGA
jgi:hypothetical protein